MIRDIAKDIINIEINLSKSIYDALNDFYDVMRKYNIKQGTQVGNGVLGNNYEWTICITLFYDQFMQKMQLERLFCNIPEDLKS
jgi:hypothetical protein